MTSQTHLPHHCTKSDMFIRPIDDNDPMESTHIQYVKKPENWPCQLDLLSVHCNLQ